MTWWAPGPWRRVLYEVVLVLVVVLHGYVLCVSVEWVPLLGVAGRGEIFRFGERHW